MALQSGDFWILRYYNETKFNIHQLVCGTQRIFTGLCLFLTSILWVPRKYDIHRGRFTLGSSILAFLHRIGFHQITVFVQLMIIQLLKSSINLTQSKVQIHYANTEVNTQEIRLDPLLLMNFYTNEDLSKPCLCYSSNVNYRRTRRSRSCLCFYIM